MTEIAVYGLPVRMPHWSFGVRYIHQLVRQSMGHSKIFEVMFPGDPCRAFLMDGNSLAENTLVTAHVLGHADFSKNNQLFARFHEMAGGNIVEKAAAHAHRIHQAIEAVGLEKVEAVLDAALALESHVDVERRAAPRALSRVRRRASRRPKAPRSSSASATCPANREPQMPPIGPLRARVPPHPEYDLLWFIANYAPELEQWERDIFLAVRAESLYFYPVFACQIMNEGWASYWHARLLRDADFLPQQLYLAAIKAHSDVVRPFASGEQTALAINPYHLGFTLWEHIVEKRGLELRAPGDEGGGRLRLHPQLARRASWRRSSTCSSTRRGRATRSASPTATSRRCARRSSRPSSTSARRASPRSSSSPTAAWCSPTSTRATAAAWTPRARARCWSTRAGCGAARCGCTPSTSGPSRSNSLLRAE